MNWPYKYDLLQRYRLIEIIALWEGQLNAKHLVDHFGIGRQQASKDINTYLKEIGPDNLVYDASAKCYCIGPRFHPKVTNGSIDEYAQLLQRNGDLAGTFASLDLGFEHCCDLPIPSPQVRPEVLRGILLGCRHKLRLEVDYRSISAPDKDGRIIVPRVLVKAANRWHVRAFCEKNQDYRDFVLTRFFGIPEPLEVAALLPPDESWEKRVRLNFKPDPRLSPQQQDVVANDYGMTDGRLTIEVRASLAQYLLQMMNVDPHIIHADPRAQQIIIENLDEVKRWLFR